MLTSSWPEQWEAGEMGRRRFRERIMCSGLDELSVKVKENH
jgi:hypothetical protein